MSDEEDFMMDSGDEEYDFEYESADESEPDADLENQYYEAKSLKDSDPAKAVEAFRKVVEQEEEQGEWGFKALKQTMKVHFKHQQYEDMMKAYRQLLTYIKSAVTRNYSEKSINSILDYVSSAQRLDLLQEVYETTLDALKDSKNDRLWFKTNVKLGKTFLDREDWPNLTKTLRDLHKSCQTETGEDDQQKGTQLLEIYALEIQMCTAQQQNKRLKTLLERCKKIRSAIPHPMIMGIIRECGGKMHLREEQWQDAYENFFEAFKNYDESGSAKKVDCLKYLVLANMLMKSNVDPFDAPESKPYKSDPQIVAMTNLISAYQARDIRQFEKILRDNRSAIMGDPFIRQYIQDLLINIRKGVLVNLIKPYTRISLSYVAEELKITAEEVEDLAVACINDGDVQGRIDQTAGVLMLESTDSGPSRYEAMHSWADQLQTMCRRLSERIV